jgi:hypothetical protein
MKQEENGKRITVSRGNQSEDADRDGKIIKWM